MNNRDLARRPAPTYCPRCRRSDHQPDQTLCSACGDELVIKGYCPVCEAFLSLPAGGLCPKHDLELAAAPPERAGAPMMVGVGWTPVCVFTDSIAVAAARIRLEAEGVPTYLEGERMGSSSMYRVATGGVKLLVPADQLAEARIILDQRWSAMTEDYDEL